MIKTLDIEARLSAAAPSGIQFTQDTNQHGVSCAWCVLANHEELLALAAYLKALAARLSTITVFQPKAPAMPTPVEGQPEPLPATFFGGVENGGKAYEVDYHFDLDGDTLTLVVHVPAGGAVESLTKLFRGADWPEREIMEIYALEVVHHPDPRRLFLDPGIESSVLERLIPLSTLANSATTKGLWEKIMAQTEKTS